MREFETQEMIKEKCPICGCKNKVHTELLNNMNKFVGYSLKCCGCGNYRQFLLDYDENGLPPHIPYHDGFQKCIQPSFCPKKDCKLFGTCNMDDTNSNCTSTSKPEKLREDYKLSIEIQHSPRFL